MRRHALTADEAPSEAVYSVVAALENCSPLDLPPLAGTVDPDAVDALLARDVGTTRVSFEYWGYEVTVTSEEVRIRNPGSG